MNFDLEIENRARLLFAPHCFQKPQLCAKIQQLFGWPKSDSLWRFSLKSTTFAQEQKLLFEPANW
jgi:hypothetical protein